MFYYCFKVDRHQNVHQNNMLSVTRPGLVVSSAAAALPHGHARDAAADEEGERKEAIEGREARGREAIEAREVEGEGGGLRCLDPLPHLLSKVRSMQ
jgi:hypothetical protein